MSINWVMLAPSSKPSFTPLPGEQVLYTSPPRIAFAITTPAHYPAKQQQPFATNSSSGQVYLTSRRVIYLPSNPTESLRSFAAPFLNLHDSHVTAPFFGPNIWQALLQPVPNGGIPIPSTGVVELKFTFKEGGAFDFHSKYEQLKERAQQIREVSGETMGTTLHDADLEELPVYREESDRPLVAPVIPQTTGAVVDRRASASDRTRSEDGRNLPSEPPPQYEEAVKSRDGSTT